VRAGALGGLGGGRGGGWRGHPGGGLELRAGRKMERGGRLLLFWTKQLGCPRAERGGGVGGGLGGGAWAGGWGEGADGGGGGRCVWAAGAGLVAGRASGCGTWGVGGGYGARWGGVGGGVGVWGTGSGDTDGARGVECGGVLVGGVWGGKEGWWGEGAGYRVPGGVLVGVTNRVCGPPPWYTVDPFLPLADGARPQHRSAVCANVVRTSARCLVGCPGDRGVGFSMAVRAVG